MSAAVEDSGEGQDRVVKGSWDPSTCTRTLVLDKEQRAKSKVIKGKNSGLNCLKSMSHHTSDAAAGYQAGCGCADAAGTAELPRLEEEN